MSSSGFNPYHKWLGIPAEQQPPNHYRLLGIELFESDPDVIESAAMRQMSHVRSFSIGQHGALSQSILNEIAEAKLSLLSPDGKRAYDESLRKLKAPSEVVHTVQCPACSAAWVINESLHGKTVKCTNCNSNCQISADGKKTSKTSAAIKSVEVAPFGERPQPDLQSFTPKSSATSFSKVNKVKSSRNKNAFVNWIALVAVPVGAICGLCLAIVLLWVLFEKDPLGIMIADANVQESENTSTTLSPSTNEKQTKSAAVDTSTDESNNSAKFQEPPYSPPFPAIAPFEAAKAKQYQQDWAKYLGVDVEIENSIGMKLRVIAPGTFTLGDDAEAPVVTLTKPYMLGVFPVTQEQYEKVTGVNPSRFKGASNPVEQVSWADAIAFCRKLSELSTEKAAGRVYRLPTDAEWEFACRAGTTTKYSFGDDQSKGGDYAWFIGNSGNMTHPVGGKQSNAWGLYDMYGNVWEWCQDWYHGLPRVSVTDPFGPSRGSTRVRRGGCWKDAAVWASPARIGSGPARRDNYGGFRVVFTATQQKTDTNTLDASISGNTPKLDSSKKTSLEETLTRGGLSMEPTLGPDNTNPPVKTKDVPLPAIAPFDAAKAQQYQEVWAQYLGVEVETENSIGMKFRVIPAGTFTMGSNDGKPQEKPAHQVTLTQPFMLGKYEVTLAHYQKIMGTNPSKFEGTSNPVDGVTWNDAVEFCRKLSERPAEKEAGNIYRLPTEAEWEYACRAGTTTKFSFGSDESDLTDYDWFIDNSGNTTHPVGRKKNNAWGLYDMHGNVWEWCQDWHGTYPNANAADPSGPSTASNRVFRGGSWGLKSVMCRSACRYWIAPSFRNDRSGFFVCVGPTGD